MPPAKVEVAVEVETKLGAVSVPYVVRAERKSALLFTSRMLPVVVVAFVPTRTTYEALAGAMARELVVVDQTPAPPEPIRSCEHSNRFVEALYTSFLPGALHEVSPAPENMSLTIEVGRGRAAEDRIGAWRYAAADAER